MTEKQKMQRAYAQALRGLASAANLPGTADAQARGLLPYPAVVAITRQIKDLELLLRANYRKYQESYGSKQLTDPKLSYAELARDALVNDDWPVNRSAGWVARRAKRRREAAFNGVGQGQKDLSGPSYSRKIDPV